MIWSRGCRISGDIRLDGVDIYKDRMDVNVTCASEIGVSVPEARHASDVHL